MPIEITARHMDVGNEVREYAERRATALAEEFPRVEHVHVILDCVKHQRIAEIIVQAKNHIRVEAVEKTDTLTSAIDIAYEKAARQLRRLRDKVQDRRYAKRAPNETGETEELSVER
ncbi:MAG: ribosome-associated translation inhibitor RaiA [Lentisphaerae bacterium]|nr:ribosome-associated translation inhibitor RaiA [Lentisphaerota bacterium]